MQSQQNGERWILCFVQGEEVMAGITEFCKAQTIEGGFFYGLGALSSATLAFYDLPSKVYQARDWQQPLELLNLSGSVGWSNNEPVVHAHATIADEAFKTMGGHVVSAVVGVTVEICFEPTSRLPKQLDEVIGLKLFQLDKADE